MLKKSLETNSTQFFGTYTMKQRLIDIEAEMEECCDNFGKERLRRERLTLLKSLKAEMYGVSMSHQQPIIMKIKKR